MSVRKNQGFSLIELLTAVVIIGVLAAVALPSFRLLRINSQISTLSADLASTLSRARSLAITTRSPVFVIQGIGTSASDVTMTSGAKWSDGWRISKGATFGTSVAVSRVLPASSITGINVLVTGGAVDATGTTAGAALTGFAFNNFGQLMKTDGTALTQAAIVICAPGSANESGRAISLSRAGRVSNNPVTNPVSCGS